MVYMIQPAYGPGRDSFLGNYKFGKDVNMNRILGIRSKPEEMPKVVDFLSNELPPDAMSFGYGYLVVSRALRTLLESYVGGDKIHFLPISLRLTLHGNRLVEFYLIDQLPKAARIVVEKSPFKLEKGLNLKGLRSLSLLPGHQTWVMRAANATDPAIWEEEIQDIGDSSYGAASTGYLVSDDLWASIAESFPGIFHALPVSESAV
jgi:hypothetical protein